MKNGKSVDQSNLEIHHLVDDVANQIFELLYFWIQSRQKNVIFGNVLDQVKNKFSVPSPRNKDHYVKSKCVSPSSFYD